uniref:Accessory protein 3b n=1 Tax=Feline coronavirus TaxID=12663 RepID=A0A7G7FCB9_9ALPC|nr:accessory protein 3b [Feline coronavirus]
MPSLIFLVIKLFNITVYDLRADIWYKLPFPLRLRIIKNSKPRATSTIKQRSRRKVDYRKVAILNAARR